MMDENTEFQGSMQLNESEPKTEPAETGAELIMQTEQESKVGTNTEPKDGIGTEETGTVSNESNEHTQNETNSNISEAVQGIQEIRNRVRNAESVFNAIKPRIQYNGTVVRPSAVGSSFTSITDLLPRPKSSIQNSTENTVEKQVSESAPEPTDENQNIDEQTKENINETPAEELVNAGEAAESTPQSEEPTESAIMEEACQAQESVSSAEQEQPFAGQTDENFTPAEQPVYENGIYVTESAETNEFKMQEPETLAEDPSPMPEYTMSEEYASEQTVNETEMSAEQNTNGENGNFAELTPACDSEYTEQATSNENETFTEQQSTDENALSIEQPVANETGEPVLTDQVTNETEEQMVQFTDTTSQSPDRKRTRASLLLKQLEISEASTAYTKLHGKVSDILKRVRQELAENDKTKTIKEKNFAIERIHPVNNIKDNDGNVPEKPVKKITVSTGGVLRGIGNKRKSPLTKRNTKVE